MVRQYASFVMRCWYLATGDLRIRIEHLQSGVTVQVTSFAEALAWLEAHTHDPPGLDVSMPPSGELGGDD